MATVNATSCRLLLLLNHLRKKINCVNVEQQDEKLILKTVLYIMCSRWENSI
jgi:hypothetical protein